MLDALFADVRAVDWNDLATVTAASDKLLTTLGTDRELLRRLADGTLADPDLLHVFLPGYFDRPHNHRWTYASRILAGSYAHTLYGTDEGIGNDIDPAALTPRMVRIERPGDHYTLHHSMIHSVVAEPYTVSLVARGPAIKDRFIVTDRHTGQAWWQYGAASKDWAEAAQKRMTADQARDCVNCLVAGGIFR